VNPRRFAVVFGAVQMFLALSWTVYVVYLPRLAAEAGVERAWVPWILIADQLIFAACDWAAGVWSDRVSRVVGRLGRIVAIATAISCVAFIALPFVAPGNKELFLVAIVLWSATSSALHAPPLALLGRHAPKPSHPFLAAVLLCGLGIAGAASPYLSGILRDIDARIPFAVASAALFAAAWVLSWAERKLPRSETKPAAKPDANIGTIGWFAFAVLLLGFAFQIHFPLNAAPSFLRFASEDMTEWLLPLFWFGFAIGVVPAAFLTRLWGGPLTMALGAVIAAAAAFIVAAATNLDTVATGQLVTGGAWGMVMTSTVAAALAFGHIGAEGRVSGLMFSALALAAAGRIALVATAIVQAPDVAPLLPWAPTAAWLLAAMMLLCMLASGRARKA
jgi:MFS family permease